MGERTRTARRLALLAVAGLALAACGHNNTTVAQPTQPTQPVAATPVEDTFGNGFGADFRASSNSEPTEPATTDLNAVSLTTEPKALH